MSKYKTQNYFSSPKNKNNNLIERQNDFHYNKNSNILKDDKLSFTLTTLGLGNLINFFNEKNISFIDLLILSQESMKELELEMYQRNRIYNFSKLFNKNAKNYSMDEIIQFFENNKQFLFVPKIYDEIISSNNNKIIINNENKNLNNNESPRNADIKLKNKRQIRNSTTKKSKKGKNMLKKYLTIKKDVDDFLNKLNKQKEDTQILSYKYGNFIKKLNFEEKNEEDIMILDEKNIIQQNDINKLMDTIKNLENKKIDQNTFEHLNKIKNYVINKGENLMSEEINKLQNEIEKMIELNIKKEKLKNNLQMYENKIKEKKNLIIQSDNNENFISNNNNYN